MEFTYLDWTSRTRTCLCVYDCVCMCVFVCVCCVRVCVCVSVSVSVSWYFAVAHCCHPHSGRPLRRNPFCRNSLCRRPHVATHFVAAHFAVASLAVNRTLPLIYVLEWQVNNCQTAILSHMYFVILWSCSASVLTRLARFLEIWNTMSII